MFEENVGVGAEEIVTNQEYVAYTEDSDDVIQVHCIAHLEDTRITTSAKLFKSVPVPWPGVSKSLKSESLPWLKAFKCLYQFHRTSWFIAMIKGQEIT